MDRRTGERYYQRGEVAERYDTERFSGRGGRYIRRVEREAFLSVLPDVEGKTVLDVATGTGRFALDLAERGADVTGVDISAEMLDRARAKAAERDLDVEFGEGDARDLAFEADAFDLVTAGRFLHLVPDQEPFVREMARVARDRVAYDYFSTWSLRILYDWLLPMGSHLHRPRAVRQMLRGLGLDGIQETRRMFVPYGAVRGRSGLLARALIGLDRAVSRAPVARRLDSVVYVSARV